jgi:hypothetical protein
VLTGKQQGRNIIGASMIRSTGNGLFVIYSEKSGKRLSKPTSKKRAVARLRQIEYFKHHKGAKS